MPQPQQADKEVVIVTGSSGLLGRNVIDRLATQYQVIGFDRDGNPQPRREVECICLDLTDDSSVQLGLDRVAFGYGRTIASVVHLAAYYNFSGEESPLYEEVTVKGTQRLIRKLQDFDVEQFIFSSTMLVHKPTEPGRPITEDDPLEGKWDYPKSKIRTEELLRNERGSIPVVLLRIAGVYTDTGDSIPLVNQIDRIYERSITSHVYPGDTSRGQAFVHLDDVIEAVHLAIERRSGLPDVAPILIGEPETLSYKTLQNIFGRLIHGEEKWTTREIPRAVAKTGAWVQDEVADIPGAGVEEPFIKPWMIDMADDHYELDISRARELLGWAPKHHLRDTLPKMIDALKRDPAGWYEHHKMDPPSGAETKAEREAAATASSAMRE